MSRSLNEIEALSKRAARGAGMSWGMAEEAGKAARFLSSRDLGGCELLADLLLQNEDIPHDQIAPAVLEGVWKAPAGALCPLIAGTCLNDCADRLSEGGKIEMSNVSHALLVVPFAASAARYIDAPILLRWGEAHVTTDGDQLWTNETQEHFEDLTADLLSCSLAASVKGKLRRSKLRGDVSVHAWAQLETFAHRTYAPATEESRLLGAGAGASDND